MSVNMQEKPMKDVHINLSTEQIARFDFFARLKKHLHSFLKKIVVPGVVSENAAIVGSYLAIVLIFWLDVITDPIITFHILYVVPLIFVALHGSHLRWVVGALMFSILLQGAYTFMYQGHALGMSIYLCLLIAFSNTICVLVARYSRAHILEVSYLSCSDPLTHLCNRRGLDKAMEREVLRQRRFGGPLSLVLLDLDGFKGLNDTQGHDVGDEALIMVADILRNQIRQTDTIARLGGDEFVIVMPNTSAAHCHSLCNLLCYTIRTRLTETFSHPLSTSIGFTCSEEVIDDAANIFSVADQALYRGKENGKGCVVRGYAEVNDERNRKCSE